MASEFEMFLLHGSISIFLVFYAQEYRISSFYSRFSNIVWKYLMNKLCETPGPAVLHWVKQLETWIYMLLSSPVPVPGKCYLEVRIVIIVCNIFKVHWTYFSVLICNVSYAYRGQAWNPGCVIHWCSVNIAFVLSTFLCFYSLPRLLRTNYIDMVKAELWLFHAKTFLKLLSWFTTEINEPCVSMITAFFWSQ